MSGIPGQPAANPADLNSPVPGKSQLDAFMATQGQAAAAPGQAAQQGGGSALDSFMAQQGDAAQPEAPQSTFGKALDTAGRVLDYPGGFVREGIAQVAGGIDQALGGHPNDGKGMITKEDQANIEQGKGPGMAEYLRRLGVSDGLSMNLPGIGKVSVRGAEGLALDILSDPLTAIAKVAKEYPVIKDLVNIPGKASDALGQAIYSTAIKARDAEDAAKTTELLSQYGKNAVAGGNLQFAGAPVGGSAKIAQQIGEAANVMGQMRQGLYDEFSRTGAGVIDSSRPELYKNAEAVIANMKQNPNLAPTAEAFGAYLDKFKAEAYVPIDRMSLWKSQLYDSLPQSAYNGGRMTAPAKMFKAALAADFKNAIVKAGNEARPGLGDAIDGVNEKWGALLNSEPISGQSGSIGREFDALAGALGSIPGYLKKKALDMTLGSYGQTLVGKALMNAGGKDFMNSLNAADAALRERQKILNQPVGQSDDLSQ